MNVMSDNKKTFPPRPHLYGTTVVGERGQAVIPAEARKAMGLKQGDKLLVFGMRGGMISLTKLSSFEKFQARMAKQFSEIQKEIKKIR